MPPVLSPLLRLALTDSSSVCLRCARKLARSAPQQARQSRTLSTSTTWKHSAAARVDERYFLSNGFRDGQVWTNAGSAGAKKVDNETIKAAPIATATLHTPAPINAATAKEHSGQIPRPRRRGRLKDNDAPTPTASDTLPELPQDASSALSTLASAAPPLSLRRHCTAYLALTKPRLASLIVLTTAASYSLYPVPSLLSASATHTPSLSTLTLLFLTTGTFGTIASANTLNMLLEPAHDAKMSRTRNRPLVRGLIKPRGAVLFAIATAVLGTGVLWWGVNPTTAVLGATNIVLYAFVYTPLKRISVLNTWAGAVVGAIPPLMGWCAAGGQYAAFPSTTPPSPPSATAAAAAADAPPPSTRPETTWQALQTESRTLLLTPQATGGYLLAALLFAWQFPHFNALSHPIRHEYLSAGYRMCVSLYPALNTRVALRYSLLMFPICAGLTAAGITDRGFLLSSSVVNGWMLRESWRFYRSGGGEGGVAAKAARGLFWASVWHLPLVLVLAMAHKRGLWDGVWRGLVGEGEGFGGEDEDGEWEDE